MDEWTLLIQTESMAICAGSVGHVMQLARNLISSDEVEAGIVLCL